MQNDLDAGFPQLDIQILGVNGSDAEAGNTLIAQGRDIPWLHDVADDSYQSDVWTNWNITWRDVVILDAGNVEVGRINLTIHNLSDQDNYDALHQMFVAAAIPEPSTITLAVIGLLSFLACGRRKRH